MKTFLSVPEPLELAGQWVLRCGSTILTNRSVWFLCRWDEHGNREDLSDGRGRVRHFRSRDGAVRVWEKLTGLKAVPVT